MGLICGFDCAKIIRRTEHFDRGDIPAYPVSLLWAHATVANGVIFISTCQPADKRSDFVPRFASYDQLTVLDLVRLEIQSCRSSIHDYRKSGNAGWSLDAPGSTLDRLGRNTSAV